ncbi:MAG: hypothetical protein GY926_17615, partial [bacterium]|nr:hypothetical protein [bacterium]
ADDAWFGFLSDFMRDVFMPNGTALMAMVIIFEIGVGALAGSHFAQTTRSRRFCVALSPGFWRRPIARFHG